MEKKQTEDSPQGFPESCDYERRNMEMEHFMRDCLTFDTEQLARIFMFKRKSTPYLLCQDTTSENISKTFMQRDGWRNSTEERPRLCGDGEIHGSRASGTRRGEGSVLIRRQRRGKQEKDEKITRR